MVRSRTVKVRLLALAAALAAAASLTACSPTSMGDQAGSAGASGSQTTAVPTTPAATPAVVAVQPADKVTDVKPDEPVVLRASTGTLQTVSVADAKGNKILGRFDTDGSWASSGRLKPDTAYTVSYTATGPDGTNSEEQTTFRTLKPKVTATYSIVYNGQTVGVGMPISIQFDSIVTSKAYRAEVEKNVTVTTVPKQEGSWGWLDARQLMWRPKNYWKPGTKVTVEASLTGVQTGDNKWVANDASGGFNVGDAMISTVNIATHQMTVTRNGKTIRTLPISAGRNEMPYITRSGVKVIIEKLPSVIMDSATSGIPEGDPDYYREVVDWDLRVTWTGEYLHSAPWSVAAQGNANVSHGCVNLSPANAKWMYDQSRVGDVVKFVGSDRVFKPYEGIGVWQYSYDGWKSQSALV